MKHPDWRAADVARNSRGIDAALEADHPQGRIATLSPQWIIDSRHDFYLQLASGPFAYRTADRYDAAEQARLHITSPRTIAAMLDRDPPAAIYGGWEKSLDRPLFDYAVAHHYRRLPDQVAGGVLYIEPSSGSNAFHG